MKTKVDIKELARAITTNGWVADIQVEYGMGDWLVNCEGMQKFINSWYYSPTECGWVIPDKWFIDNYETTYETIYSTKGGEGFSITLKI